MERRIYSDAFDGILRKAAHDEGGNRFANIREKTVTDTGRKHTRTPQLLQFIFAMDGGDIDGRNAYWSRQSAEPKSVGSSLAFKYEEGHIASYYIQFERSTP